MRLNSDLVETMSKQNNAKKSSIWGGRFSSGPSQLMQDINASISYDKRLYSQDIAGSKAHASMLASTNIISDDDCAAIHKGLDHIGSEIAAGQFAFSESLEDIHMNIESRLAELIGEPARRLHTARSRNDQVATDFKLWVRDLLDSVDLALADMQAALLVQAEAHADLLMPGFTHLQTAQPVTFGFHLMAYVEMLGRDRGRFADARKRLNESPLGAAALAGTSFPIDRHMTASTLGFDRPAANAMDAVSDRDFALQSPCPPPRSVQCICHALPKSLLFGLPISLALLLSQMLLPQVHQSCRKSGIPMLLNWCAPSLAESLAH